MAIRDEQLNHLFDLAVVARRHHIAVGVAAAFRAINSIEPPTVQEIETGDAAEAACAQADQALLDYQRDHRSS